MDTLGLPFSRYCWENLSTKLIKNVLEKHLEPAQRKMERTYSDIIRSSFSGLFS